MDELSSPAQPTKDSVGDCVIRVRGWLDPSLLEMYDKLSISMSTRRDHVPEACVSGHLADQSALVGLIVALHQFGLTLLSVEWLEPRMDPSTQAE